MAFHYYWLMQLATTIRFKNQKEREDAYKKAEARRQSFNSYVLTLIEKDILNKDK